MYTSKPSTPIRFCCWHQLLPIHRYNIESPGVSSGMHFVSTELWKSSEYLSIDWLPWKLRWSENVWMCYWQELIVFEKLGKNHTIFWYTDTGKLELTVRELHNNETQKTFRKNIFAKIICKTRFFVEHLSNRSSIQHVWFVYKILASCRLVANGK